MGSYGKTRIFRPKIEFSGPKKHPLLNSDHVLATNGKSCANKKSTLFPNKYQSFSKFRVFFLGGKKFF